MAKMPDGNLPEGWEWKTVDDLAEDIQYGYTQSADDKPVGPKFLRITDIQNGKVDWNPVPYCECSEQDFPKYKLEPGDIVFARTGATTGKSFLIHDCPDAVFASYLIRLRLKPEVNVKYFYDFLQSSDYWSQITTVKKGSAQPGLNATVLATLQLPVAPLPEQERIVSRIEQLFSDLETGVAALERVRAGLKRYKASVLTAAVGGKLVNGKYPSSTMSGIGEGELPQGWRIVKVEDVAETIGGVTKGRNFRGKKTITLPYLRVANVQRGRLDLDEMKEIELFESEIEKYRLRDGDVVLTEGGDWDKLGRSAIWRNQIDLCVHQNHIFRARVKDSDILPEWLMYFTNSEVGQDYFKEAAKQTTNLASINLTQLRNCPVNLPPLDEQRRIVAEVERRLSVVSEVESAAKAGLVRAARLRQAVLRSAFEGKL